MSEIFIFPPLKKKNMKSQDPKKVLFWNVFSVIYHKRCFSGPVTFNREKTEYLE